jgi:spermidine synthase
MNYYKLNYKLILAITFISGIPALIYEIVWARMLATCLGSSVYSITITTATFMLGLALGAYFFGQYAEKTSRYLKLYAFLEFGICLSAFIFLVMFLIIKKYNFGFTVFPAYFQYTFIIMQRMVLVFLGMLIPTFFMGGTLPVLSKIIKENLSISGRITGYLYALNTIGSVIGCLLTIFILVQQCGLMRSAMIASALNILIGFSCILLDKQLALRTDKTALAWKLSLPTFLSLKTLVQELSLQERTLLLVFGLSGFTALAYEILFTRLLVFWLESSIFSFGIILAVFLSSLALGSLVSSRLLDRFSKKQLMNYLAFLQLFIAIAAFISIALYNIAARMWIAGGVKNFLLLAINLPFGFLGTLFTLFFIAFPFGLIFPLIMKVLFYEKSNISEYMGLGYMANTVGATLGSLIAGLILIPALGVQKSVYLIAIINILIFLLVIIFNAESKNRIISYGFIVFTLFIILTQIVIPRDYLIKTMAMKLPEKFVFFKEGQDMTVAVAKTKEGFLGIWLNGILTSFAGPYPHCSDLKLRAHIPLLLSRNPKDVLVIGFGAGMTLGTVAELYGIKADCVEISKSVIEAGKFFSEWNYDVLNSKNINIYIMDGRNFVELTKKKYDVITVDVSLPYLANTNSLFSKEFYERCKELLKEDGLILQWTAGTTEVERKRLVKTFLEVFDNSYMVAAQGMLGLKKPLCINKDYLDKKISENSKLKQDLQQLGIFNGRDFLQLIVTDKNGLHEFTKGVLVITDDFPRSEFSTDVLFYHSIPRPDVNYPIEIRLRTDLNLTSDACP